MRPKSEPIAPPYDAAEQARLDVPAVLRRAEETRQTLSSTAKVVRDALLPFHGQPVDLDVIEQMAASVVATLREKGLL